MFSQYRAKHKEYTASYFLNDIGQYIQGELQKSDDNVFDPLITHVMSRLQPWILTIMVIFGLYFILIIAILVLILRNDIKK